MTGVREGRLDGGLPCIAVGDGPPLVVIKGFTPTHTNPTGVGRFIEVRTTLRGLAAGGYTVYSVNRRPGLAPGTTMADVANDYAVALGNHFGEPPSVMGYSTGGSIALQLAIDHPTAVHKLVIAMAAHTLGPVAKKAQLGLAEHAARGKAGYHLLAPGITGNPILQRLVGAALHVANLVARPPKDPSDMIAMIRAEDAFSCRDRLGAITAPTLVAGGAKDRLYSPQLCAETARGIPDAELVIYPDAGHTIVSSRAFTRDTLAFLAR